MQKIIISLALCGFLSSLTTQSVGDFQFAVETLGGQRLNEEQFQNSVLLVDYWGTWCPPCKKAVPFLQEMYKKYKHHGLEIVGFTYERGAPAKAKEALREFAVKYGITYPLALGTPALKRQVKGFQGYPTLLFFNRGLQFDHGETGFAPTSKPAIESWIRRALGLPVAEEKGKGLVEIDPDEQVEAEEPDEEEEKPEALDPGVIFKPGDADTGFEFKAKDVDGKEIEFAKLRDKPVVIALTSTWDTEAVPTAKLLNKLNDQFGDSVHVFAASLELGRQPVAKVNAIVKFRTKHKLGYRMFPAGLSFQMKIHQFSGMPVFLVFDKQGVLRLRESGNSEAIGKKITESVDSLK